jgi:ElaB/YqjD/DUF883 family membrane-anchored ribosome-binding protein
MIDPMTQGSNAAPRGPGSSELQNRAEALKEKVGNAYERGKSEFASSTQDTRDRLTEDMAKLREDMAAIQQTLASFASQASSGAANTARSMGNAVASEVGQAASEVASAATEQAKTVLSEIESMARRNPLGTLGGTLLVGVIIGMMSRGRA